MICQECNQRPATLHFKKIINGQTIEVHVCEKCAQEKSELFMESEGVAFSINNLLAGLLNIESSFQTKANALPKHEEPRCSNCQLSYRQFVQLGKFGCAECCKTFDKQLDPILKRVHSGNTAHIGKIPKRIGGSLTLKKQILELKQNLQLHIAEEEFEQAAELRDKIRILEQSFEKEGEGK